MAARSEFIPYRFINIRDRDLVKTFFPVATLKALSTTKKSPRNRNMECNLSSKIKYTLPMSEATHR
jgi:hypothetical protein